MHQEPWVLSRKHVLIASWEAALVEEEEKTELCEALGCSSGRHRALFASLTYPVVPFFLCNKVTGYKLNYASDL